MDPHANLVRSTVAVAPSPAASGTSLTVAAGEGAIFPATALGAYNCIVWPNGAEPTRANCEIVRVTTRAVDVFTITRTQESTSARTIVVGDQIALVPTAKTFTDIEVSPTFSGYGRFGANAAPSNVSAGHLTVDTALFTPDIYGSITNGASGVLTLRGTSNATPGAVILEPGAGNVGIGVTPFNGNVKLQVKPGTDQHFAVVIKNTLSNGIQIQSLNDATAAAGMEFLASTFLFTTGNVGINATPFNASVTLQVKPGTNQNFVITGKNTLTNGIQIQALTDATATAGMEFYGSTFMFTSGGIQVGVPTGGDKGGGTINTAGDIYKNNSAYANPDYVFEYAFTGRIERYKDNEGAAEYVSRTLTEIEAFARENLHLPMISREPTGSFARLDALLAHVEEVYLYLFEHEKRLRALEV